MADPKITIKVEGSGLPQGGSDGQVLTRQDGKAVWGDALPKGSTPHQQLVTDGDGVAKWEDKPFGDYKTTYEVIPEQSPQAIITPATALLFEGDAYIEQGKRYTIYINGVARDYVAEVVEFDGALATGFNIDGHVLADFFGSGDCLVIPLHSPEDAPDILTLRIVTEVDAVKTLPAKYVVPVDPDTQVDLIMMLSNGEIVTRSLSTLYFTPIIGGSGESFSTGTSFDKIFESVMYYGILPVLKLTGASNLPTLMCRAWIDHAGTGFTFFYEDPSDGTTYKIKVSKNGTVNRLV